MLELFKDLSSLPMLDPKARLLDRCGSILKYISVHAYVFSMVCIIPLAISFFVYTQGLEGFSDGEKTLKACSSSYYLDSMEGEE